MRVLILSLALIGGLASLAGCQSSGSNSAAMQAMDNPPNACGSDGSNNINDCQGGRR